MELNPQRFKLKTENDRALRPPKSGHCFLPTVRRLDRRFLPIWNSGVLVSEWRMHHRLAMGAKEGSNLLSRKELKEREKGLLARSLAGPLPRQVVADAAHISLVEIRKLAKARGFWVRHTQDDLLLNPFEAAMRSLFVKAGYPDEFWDFYCEVEADMRAQEEIDKLRRRRLNPPAVPKRIGIWDVLSEPFLAIDKADGLSWWVEFRCGVEGCRYHQPRFRSIRSLKKSKAKKCREHGMEPAQSVLSMLDTMGDRHSAVMKRHVPAIFRSGFAEARHPDMAQGALQQFRTMLANPPSLIVPKPMQVRAPRADWSAYFPPAPYEEPEFERDEHGDIIF